MARPKAVKDISDPRLIRALAHPLRVAIIKELQDAEMSPKDLSDKLEEPLGNVSYHVRALHSLGLVKLMRKVPRRGAVAHYYRAVAAPVSASAWEGMPSVVREGMMGTTLAQVGAVAAAAASGGGFERPEAALTSLSMSLDPDGWKALGKAAADFEKAVNALKPAKNGDGVDAHIVTLVFEPRAARPEPQRRRGRPPKDA